MISAAEFKVRAECDPLDVDCDGFIDDMELSITPSKITFSVSDTAQITITDGTAPYSVISNDTGVAKVVGDNFDDGNFEVKGIAEGTTTISITDSENKIGEVEVDEVETDDNEENGDEVEDEDEEEVVDEE
ncbi:MAG: hypothetical protein U9P10_00755 [Thermodesulfobacteriota bacterium]|nr:hypothetical protein [Thermodesulfobacteriota bacterium]